MRSLLEMKLSFLIWAALFVLLAHLNLCFGQNYNQDAAVTSTTSGSCFSRNTWIKLADSSQIRVSELKPGQFIRTFDYTTNKVVDSKFIDYLHFDKSAIFKFISIKTAGTAMPSLEISEYHLIQRLKRDSDNANHEFVFAKDLIVGDKLYLLTKDDEPTMKYVEITSLDEVYEQGAYAPLTEHGTLIVNNVLASCYANSPYHGLIHAFFQPYIVFSRLTSSSNIASSHKPEQYMNIYVDWLLHIFNHGPIRSLIIL